MLCSESYPYKQWKVTKMKTTFHAYENIPLCSKMAIRMNTRFLICILLLLFMSLAVSGQTCDISKAKQYALDGETVELYKAVIKIGDNDYCVFLYKDHDPLYSEVMVFDISNNRLNEKDTTLNECIFSYKSADYMETHYMEMQPQLQAIYDDLIANAHQYDPRLDEIRHAVDTAAQYIKIDIPIYGALKLDAAKALRDLVLNKPTWSEIVQRYKGYKETIDQLSIAKQKGYISYDHEVKVFHSDGVAIDNFVKSLDDEANTGISSKLGSLSFSELAKRISVDSVSENQRINQRIKERKRVSNEKLILLYQSIESFDGSIYSALGKDLDVSGYKQDYCRLLKSKPDDSLIDKEMFQTYIEEADKVNNELLIKKNELDEKRKNAENKFVLWAWLSKGLWKLKSC